MYTCVGIVFTGTLHLFPTQCLHAGVQGSVQRITPWHFPVDDLPNLFSWFRQV